MKAAGASLSRHPDQRFILELRAAWGEESTSRLPPPSSACDLESAARHAKATLAAMLGPSQFLAERSRRIFGTARTDLRLCGGLFRGRLATQPQDQ